MQKFQTSASFLAVAVMLMAGCLSTGCSRRAVESPAADDSVVWLEEDIQHAGMTIALGYRKQQASDRGWIEPVARITRGGKPVADAMVFNSVVAVDGHEARETDVATVYETAGEGESALYGQAMLQLPESATRCTVRFRMILPDGEEWMREVEIQLLRDSDVVRPATKQRDPT